MVDVHGSFYSFARRQLLVILHGILLSLWTCTGYGVDAAFADLRAHTRLRGARRLLESGNAMRPWAPRRDPAHGPWADTWTNKIAICASARNENATDVNEWLTYYKWLGIDHIFFTENESEWTVKDAIKEHIDAGFVTFDTLAGAHGQMTIYHKCIQQHGMEFDWMAFFDLDEFLVVRERGKTLKEVLNDYRFFPGLAVHWIMVGSNHRATRPPEGGVLKHYTQCAPGGSLEIKSIANMFYVEHAGIHPHGAVYRAYAVPVNEQFMALPYRFGISDASCPAARLTSACPVLPGHTFPRTSRSPSVTRVALYHYVTRSEEDFLNKQKRAGGTTNSPKTLAYFQFIQRMAVEDPICLEPAKLHDLCCKSPGVS